MKKIQYNNYYDETYYQSALERILDLFNKINMTFSYQELSDFFEMLEMKDNLKPNYLQYKLNIQKDIYIALKSTNLVNYDDKESFNKIVESIFNNFMLCEKKLPLYALLMKNKEEIKKRFVFNSIDKLIHLQKNKKGIMLVTHHLGSFKFTMMGLVTLDVPITITVADYMADFVRSLIPPDVYSNVTILPIYTGMNNNENNINYVLFSCAKKLKEGHIVLFLGDKSVYPNKQKSKIKFLDNYIFAPQGPVKLADISKSSILHVYSEFINDKVMINFMGHIPYSSIQKNGIDKTIKNSFGIMEEIIREKPYLWTYFADYQNMKIY